MKKILDIIKSWFVKPIDPVVLVETSTVPVEPVTTVEHVAEVVPVVESIQPKEVKPTIPTIPTIPAVSAKKPVGRPRKTVVSTSTVLPKVNNFSAVHHNTVIEEVNEVYVSNDIIPTIIDVVEAISYASEPTVETVIVEETSVFSGFSESSDKLFGGAGATESFEVNPTVESVVETQSYTPSYESASYPEPSSSFESLSESYTDTSSTDW